MIEKMSTIRIRLQTATGASQIETLPASTATVYDLRAAAARAAGLSPDDDAAAARLVLRTGFPPAPLDWRRLPPDARLADTDWALNGARIAVEVEGQGLPPAPTATATATAPPPAAAAQTASSSQAPLQLRRAQPSPASAGPDAARDPPAVALPALGATLALRVMPDDNACLFRALALSVAGAATDDNVALLRRTVAQAVLASPDEFSPAVLDGRAGDEYAAWIASADAWGGYIEMSVIARAFGVRVVAVDVASGAVVDCGAGEDEAAGGRACVVVYSGIHYDAVALVPEGVRVDDTAEDVFQFDWTAADGAAFAGRPGGGAAAAPDDGFAAEKGGGGGEATVVIAGAVELARVLRRRGYYTDAARMGVRCGVCGWRGEGERAAREHADETGHASFSEENAGR